MSQYGIIYRLEFQNAEAHTVRVDISPTDILIPDPDTPQIIPLKPSGEPFTVSSSNDKQDKLSPIRSKSASIQFVSDSGSGLDSATFSRGGDDLFVVTAVIVGGDTIFTGYLIMADNQQPFQPDPNYVTLTATDHLAALKEVALTNNAGETPVGKFRVADILSFCLRKTGLLLDLFVVNNLRIGSGQFTGVTTFTASPNQFITESTNFFYEGQVITITGTSLNNMTCVVLSAGVGIVTIVATDGTFVNEGPVSATFTDLFSTGHWYDLVYIDAKTFEASIGTCEDCYRVIEKILGEDCFITQYKGAWWIYRVDEMEGNLIYVAEFSASGTYISTAAGTDYDKSLGRSESSKFARADTDLRFIRPHGFTRERFNYETPLEVPCNIDFARGDLITTVSPYEKHFDLDCWGKFQENYPTSGLIPATTPIYVQREFNENGYQTANYVVIVAHTPSSNLIFSEDIPINVKDKFVIRMSRRLSADVSGSGAYRDVGMQVRLYGDDGTFWTLQGQTSTGDQLEWLQTNSDFSVFNGYFWFEGNVSRDMTQPESLYGETESPPAPVGGIVNLLAHQTHSAIWNRDTYILSVSFEYIPYINSQYARVTGQSSRIDRTESGYMANRDKAVFLSDSPCPVFKGSMFSIYGGVSRLVTRWFAAAAYGGSYPPNMDYIHPYGYIQAFAVWNQYKGYNDPVTGRGIGINIFSGSVKGLTDDWPDLIHRFSLTDANVQTNDRYFILISMEQDFMSCVWTATFIEVYNYAIMKTYSDPFTFKYIIE